MRSGCRVIIGYLSGFEIRITERRSRFPLPHPGVVLDSAATTLSTRSCKRDADMTEEYLEPGRYTLGSGRRGTVVYLGWWDNAGCLGRRLTWEGTGARARILLFLQE